MVSAPFFFDGTFAIENPLAPSSDGTATAAYTAPPGEAPLTVNGELHIPVAGTGRWRWEAAAEHGYP